MDTSTLPVAGFGSWASALPGTPQHDAARLVDTVKANVGFDKLQAMREASPPGGALGQVSETENRLLQSVLGNLEQSQSPEQFRRNLGRVRDEIGRASCRERVCQLVEISVARVS